MTDKKKPTAVSVPAQATEFAELVRRVNKSNPEPKDVEVLRQRLQESPELWRLAGDLTRDAYDQLVDLAVRDQALVAESLKAGRLAMRDELGYQHASPLERLLIDQVVLCWLRMHCAEFSYTETFKKSRPPAESEYWERRLSGAQRRYLRACETLARIQKLKLPTVQVNIGHKQVNMASSQ